MTITLDEKYNAKTDSTTLGYVGETNARIITFVGYQCEDADSYKMRFKYPDGVTYDVDISDGTYTIDGSILRRVGELHVQILACRHNGDTYDYVKKSNILTLQIGRSLNGGVSPVPTYEQSVGTLEKLFEIDKKIDNSAKALNEAITAANTAKNDLQTATSAANTAIAAVKTSTADANTAKSDLDTATANANIAQSNLSAAKSAAETALSNLNTAIAQANTSDSNLTATISNAETVKTQLSDVIANANSMNTTLAETISTATDLYTSLSAENVTATENISKLTEENAKAEGLYMKADGIVCKSEGSAIVLTDSLDLPFNGRIFGRSEQFATTGAQLLNPEGLPNMSKFNGVIITINGDGSITLNGTPTITDGIIFTIYYDEYIDLLVDGNTYTANSDCRLAIVENDKKKYATKITVNKSTITSVKPYIQITVADYKNGMAIYPMLNEGDTAMPFEPYTGGIPSPNPDYPQEIVSVGGNGNIDVDVRGGNLFDAQKIVPNSGSDVSATAQGARLELINNTGGQYKSMYYAIDRDFSNIELTLSANITASGNADGCVSVRFYSNGTEINGYRSRLDLYNSGVKTKNAPAGTDRIRIVVYSSYQKNANVGDTVIYDNIMLNIGSAALPYEPYKHQSVTLSTPNGLPGIPVDSGGNYTDENGQQWICDEIDLGRGVYVKRIDVLNIKDATWGDTWNTVNTLFHDDKTTIFNFLNGKKYRGNVGFCNAFTNVTLSDEKIGFSTSQGNGALGVRVPNELADDLSKWNEYIQNNDIVFVLLLKPQYYSETPLSVEEISAYKSLHTNKPTTTITISDSAHMAVSYTADTKTYIDNKFNELATAIVATGGDT